MSTRRLTGALLASSWLATFGCGARPDSESLGVSTHGVFGGQLSPAAHDNVIYIIDGQGSWASAVVVGANLALTARDFVSDTETGPLRNLKCTASGGHPLVQAANNPEHYRAVIGNEYPRSPGPFAKHFYGGPSLDLCDNNIALVEFDGPLASADGTPLAPMALRLDTPAVMGETGTLIGWGHSEDDAFGSPVSQRREVAVKVEKTGPGDYATADSRSITIPAASFITDQAGCTGDEGGPFVSTGTGAVVGLVSRVEQHDLGTPVAPAATTKVTSDFCAGGFTEFRDLSSQQAWIREAFAELGQAPWLEDFARPEALGGPCSADAECVSGTCSLTKHGGFCTARCEARECPSSMQCVAVQAQSWCVPSAVAGPITSGGCSLVNFNRQQSPWSMLACSALTLSVLCSLRTKSNRRLRNRL
ncbi:MAG TPA: trypsin-like serine protease [Polyangiaceae bacterium]|nr:trypsin-like serine protease [Polyangiaceae bacterium]